MATAIIWSMQTSDLSRDIAGGFGAVAVGAAFTAASIWFYKRPHLIERFYSYSPLIKNTVPFGKVFRVLGALWAFMGVFVMIIGPVVAMFPAYQQTFGWPASLIAALITWALLKKFGQERRSR